MGYVTMNQTRSLVLLEESDPSVCLAPIVGVWIQFRAKTTNRSEFLLHPFAFGACLRFLFASQVKDRALIAADTFLMVKCTHVTVLLRLRDA